MVFLLAEAFCFRHPVKHMRVALQKTGQILTSCPGRSQALTHGISDTPQAEKELYVFLQSQLKAQLVPLAEAHIHCFFYFRKKTDICFFSQK